VRSFKLRSVGTHQLEWMTDIEAPQTGEQGPQMGLDQ
jgi:hypothetical protein